MRARILCDKKTSSWMYKIRQRVPLVIRVVLYAFNIKNHRLVFLQMTINQVSMRNGNSVCILYYFTQGLYDVKCKVVLYIATEQESIYNHASD